MTKIEKKVETYTVKLETENHFSFFDILNSEELNQNKKIGLKNISYKTLESDGNYVIGLVRTTRQHSVAPKHHIINNTLSDIGLKQEEGLIYGNVFYYEISRGILMYEMNKFGIEFNQFIHFIYKCCEKSASFYSFDIKFGPLLKVDEYNRILNMTFHKSIEIKIANAPALVKRYENTNDTFSKIITTANSVGSEFCTIKFEVDARRHSTRKGIANKSLNDLVEGVKNLLASNDGRKVLKAQVVGQEKNSSREKLNAIDLIADRYIKTFVLEEPLLLHNLLESQRAIEIKNLFKSCQVDFEKIFEKNE